MLLESSVAMAVVQVSNAAQIQPLAQELLYATGAGLKRKKNALKRIVTYGS